VVLVSLGWELSVGINTGIWNGLSPFLRKACNYLHTIMVRTSIHGQKRLAMPCQFRHRLP